MAIEANPGQPLPKDVLDYLCRYLRGQIKKKPGPQTSDSTDEVITEIAAAVFYQAELSRLQNEAKNKGRRPKGSTPLHEQAAMFVKKQFVGREPVRVDDGLNI